MSDTKEEKWEVLIAEDLKIQRTDKYNFTVQTFNVTEKHEKWNIQAYCSSFTLAVDHIIKRGYLLETESIKTLEDYQGTFQESIQSLKETLEKVEGSVPWKS